MSITYDDIKCGDMVAGLSETPTLEILVRWAGASGDFTRIHYDYEFATDIASLSDIVVHGPYKLALLVRMLVDWSGGDPARLKNIKVRLSQMDFVGQELSCRGIVTSKLDAGAEVECEVWVENALGARTMSGTARLEFPRGDAVRRDGGSHEFQTRQALRNELSPEI